MRKLALYFKDTIASAPCLSKMSESDDNKYIYLFSDIRVREWPCSITGDKEEAVRLWRKIVLESLDYNDTDFKRTDEYKILNSVEEIEDRILEILERGFIDDFTRCDLYELKEIS